MAPPPDFVTVGLVSSFREGRLLEATIRSLAPLDATVVFDGPVGGNVEALGEPSSLGRRVTHLEKNAWESDAAKRTDMVAWCKARWPGREVWGLWADGDEILLWGEYLRDWLERVRQGGDPDNPVGGWPFALVELDGSVAICMGKLVRVDLIARYLVSSSYLELVNGDRRTVGNVMYWNVKDGPLFEHWRARPPLQGEPHLQHRPLLRNKGREVERQHVAEERDFVGVDLSATKGKGS